MNLVAASQSRPLGSLGQGLSGFLLAFVVQQMTWALSAVALWPVNPLLAIVGGFAVAVGACAVAYDAVGLPAVRTGMRTYFWLSAALSVVLVAAAMLFV